LIEAMANGIVSLNYAANIAMEEEEREKALKKGLTEEQFQKKQKSKEKIDWQTFLTIAVSFTFAMGLFVFLPHAITEGANRLFDLSWNLDGFAFHFVDGIVKACIFVFYIWVIGKLPDIHRVFQYHGAEHKSISTFEAGEDLTVENARKYTTLHPRCGTSFIFFLLFISIIIFSVLFSFIEVGAGLPDILKHVVAIVFKIALMMPVAGVSYEIIKFAGKHAGNPMCRALSFPGMMLQKLTTKEPDDEQLEVALASIKAVLFLEDKYKLDEQKKKVLNKDEVDIDALAEIETTNKSLNDFLE
jgi:uncharacterized protein YqhQ